MSIERVRDIADAVLFEGYILYPYRPSAIKNQQRWTFGGVFPRDYGGDEPWSMQTEILVEIENDAEVDVTIRFLHTQRRQIVNQDGVSVASLEADGRQFVAWDEAMLREAQLSKLRLRELFDAPRSFALTFPAERKIEAIACRASGEGGQIIRSCEALTGVATIVAAPVADAICRLRVTLENTTPLTERMSRAAAQRYAFLSTHMIFVARGARFISLLEPPDAFAQEAAACDNRGTWPVLAGAAPARDIVLSSPIILYDYPKVAPESKNQFFDATEIDEMLTLRVMTLTDAEKREMAAADPRARGILERCQEMSREELYELHGAFRDPSGASGAGLTVGARVRLHPRKRSDIFDIALQGKVGVVQALERDFENRLHVAVTLLDDPGGDLGRDGFPGHRFFFAADEVEMVKAEAES